MQEVNNKATVIVDYNIGNISAVANMISRLNKPFTVSASEIDILKADRIILPGTGSFDACIKNLRLSGLVPALEARVFSDKVPILGICVGAQMMGNSSEEGIETGLGWMDFDVKRFPTGNLKIPHMGWNYVKKTTKKHRLVDALDDGARFYFVHSYYMESRSINDTILEADYGMKFTAAFGKENLMGVQFHPEKSHRFGKSLIKSFLEI